MRLIASSKGICGSCNSSGLRLRGRGVVMSRKLALEDILTPGHLQMIGMIITAWATLEHALLYELSVLVSGPAVKTYDDLRVSLVLATGMKPNTLLGLMRSLVYVKFGNNDIIEFDKMRKQI